MKRVAAVGLIVFFCCACGLVRAGARDKQDWRNVENGSAVPTPGMGYVDQPYPLK